MADKRLYYLDFDTWRPVVELDIDTLIVNTFYQDNNGAFWIGTRSGAYQWTGNQLYGYDVGHTDIGHNQIELIMEDQEGNLWFHHNEGFSFLNMNSTPLPVSGLVYFDIDKDGNFHDSIDYPLKDHKVSIHPGQVGSITNHAGVFGYRFLPDTDYEITYEHNPGWQNTSDSVLDFNLVERNSKDLHFGVWREDYPKKIEMELIGTRAICYDTSFFTIHYNNQG